MSRPWATALSTSRTVRAPTGPRTWYQRAIGVWVGYGPGYGYGALIGPLGLVGRRRA